MSDDFITTVINDKNKKVYIVLNNHVIDCTNSANDKPMVLYRDLDGTMYVREYAEFYVKFTPVDNSDVKFVSRE